jgi:HAD superfamily hydrolase (TIGR01509 family)
MTVRAVLFDWDGTLAREGLGGVPAACAAVADYAARNLGVDARPADVERAFAAVLPHRAPDDGDRAPEICGVLGQAFTWLGWPASAGDVEAAARLFFETACRGQHIYDDARAVLASLKYRGYRVGVVTNSIFAAEYWRPLVNGLGLAGYLETFVSSADVGLAKPNPAPFRRALADLGIPPHEAIFVGDTPATDIAGARAAGLRAILIDRRGRRREAAGYLVIERLSALADVLGEGLSPLAGP